MPLRRKPPKTRGLAASPFHPKFGRVPGPTLIGRKWMVEQITDSMFDPSGDETETGHTSAYRGPESFLLYGARGSGKTATILKVRDVAEEHGSIAFYVQAREDGSFVVPLQEAATSALESVDLNSKERKWLKEVEVQLLSVAKVAFKERDPQTYAGENTIYRTLKQMTDIASRRGVELVVCVDEIHNLRAKDMADLSASVQSLVEAEERDFHFRGAALPYIKFGSLSSTAQSFFKRCTPVAMVPLSRSQVVGGLQMYAKSAKGSFTDEALELAADASIGSPYMLQLVGNYAWEASDAPANVIEVEHVRHAIAEAEPVYRANVENPTFADFNESHVRALTLLYNALPGTTMQEVKAQLARDQNIQEPYAQLVLNHLQEANVLTMENGRLMFSEACGMSASYLRSMLQATDEIAELKAARVIPSLGTMQPRVLSSARLALPSAGRRTHEERCGKWMPRAKTNCVRPRGHAGACRSK